MLSFDPKLFSKEFPKEVEELLLLVMRKGFSLTLIGGAVRDFLVTGKVGKDLDFELKHSMSYSNDEWISRLNFLKKEIQKQWNCEELSFNILRVFIDDIEVEFSSSRTEKYIGNGPYSHSDFEVVLNPSLDPKESVERRDFTLNSIGVSFGAPGTEEEYLLIDPLNGLKDLSLNILRPAGGEFYKDPVRMLRTLRFSIKYGYDYRNIEFSKFDLSLLTVHWLLSEAKKSGKTSFFKIFFDCIRNNKISLNEKVALLEPLSQISERLWNGHIEELMVYLIEDFHNISKSDFQLIGTTLNMPQQFVSSLYENVQSLMGINIIDKEKLRSMSDEEFSTSPEFKLVKSLYQFESKYPEILNHFSKTSISDLISKIFLIWPIGFENKHAKPDYNSLVPELRASYLFKRQLDV